MMHVKRLATVSLAVLSFVTAPAVSVARAADKPKLSLKGVPSIGTPSTVFTFQARLTGGVDDEKLYCLTAEWVWEEQADSSLNESECAPFRAGHSEIQRTFSEEQSFSRPGSHVVKLVLHKGDKEIATAVTTVTVRKDR
jgi:hypothetical protein